MGQPAPSDAMQQHLKDGRTKGAGEIGGAPARCQGRVERTEAEPVVE